MSAASENELGSLHVLIAKVLKDKLGSTDCTAADVNAAIKFLKDNNITCKPDGSNHLGELEKQLNENAEANKLAPVDDADLRAALESAQFGTGMVN